MLRTNRQEHFCLYHATPQNHTTKPHHKTTPRHTTPLFHRAPRLRQDSLLTPLNPTHLNTHPHTTVRLHDAVRDRTPNGPIPRNAQQLRYRKIRSLETRRHVSALPSHRSARHRQLAADFYNDCSDISCDKCCTVEFHHEFAASVSFAYAHVDFHRLPVGAHFHPG
jgi:hypothetical protein